MNQPVVSVKIKTMHRELHHQYNCIECSPQRRSEEHQCSEEYALRGLAFPFVNFLKDYICARYTLEAVVWQETEPWTVEL